MGHARGVALERLASHPRDRLLDARPARRTGQRGHRPGAAVDDRSRQPAPFPADPSTLLTTRAMRRSTTTPATVTRRAARQCVSIDVRHNFDWGSFTRTRRLDRLRASRISRTPTAPITSVTHLDTGVEGRGHSGYGEVQSLRRHIGNWIGCSASSFCSEDASTEQPGALNTDTVDTLARSTRAGANVTPDGSLSTATSMRCCGSPACPGDCWATR